MPEAITEAPAAVPTIREYKTTKLYSLQEYHDDSPVGAGYATAEIRVLTDLDLPDESNIDLSLSWAAEPSEQPDRWEIEFSFRVEVTWCSIREYLIRYCPCTDEMWRTLKKLDLDLPDSVRTKITEAQ